MNRWYRAVLAAGLAGAIASCTGPTVAPPAQEIIAELPPATTDQGQVTDPAPALADGRSLSIASLNLPVATIVSVGDGDTLRMEYQGQTITVRLACIDAAETTQTPWGPAATERLRQLPPRGSTIQFREADTDRYGRMVAEVYAGGQNMNLQMVREGHAVVYQQFLRSCPETDDALLAAEAQARQQRLNFWSQPNPVMPWDFRRSNRSS